MVEDRIPPPPRPARPSHAGRSAGYFKAARQRQAADKATHDALMHLRQLHLDRLKRISDAAEAAARTATKEYLDMLATDKPRLPRWPYKFWSTLIPIALLWGAITSVAAHWFFNR